jgi:hypothetical protein
MSGAYRKNFRGRKKETLLKIYPNPILFLSFKRNEDRVERDKQKKRFFNLTRWWKLTQKCSWKKK